MEENEEIKTINKFDEWAETYDKGIWSLYFNYSYKKTIKIAQKYLCKESEILDIACGTGSLIIPISFLKQTKKIIGIDISKKMIKKTLEKIKKIPHKNKNKIVILKENVNRMHFPSNKFNAAFSLNSFHHYADALPEINRVLKENGLFFLVDNFSSGILRKIWNKFLKIYFNEKKVKYFDKDGLDKLLIKNGFDILEQKTLLYFVLISVCKKRREI